MNCDVYVTGYGVVSPSGSSNLPFWEALLENRSGIAPITLFDPKDLPVAIAGEIKDFDLLDYISNGRKSGRVARHTKLALAAAAQAVRGADLGDVLQQYGESIPVVMGVSTSSFDIFLNSVDSMNRHGMNRASPTLVSQGGPQAIGCAVARQFEFEPLLHTISTNCAAGLDAVGYAAGLIRRGEAEIAIAGGCDAPISEVPYANFIASGMVSRRGQQPEKASRPFDRHRDGGVPSEGAGVVILESKSHCLARKKHPLAEITGFGLQFDRSNSEPASSLGESMSEAMDNAGVLPGEIGMINAHGPSDLILDVVETRAIHDVFGPHAHRIPVLSIKGSTGNPLAAGGVMQLISGLLCMQEGKVPPTTNYEAPDPECDLDYIAEGVRHTQIDRMIINSHGIGGGSSSVVMERLNGHA